MNDFTADYDFVPEVDAASLKDVICPQPQPPPATNGASPADCRTEQPVALAVDPELAMKQLPEALAAHIQDIIAQAEANGYLRGRNEQIQAQQHFDNPDADCVISRAVMPRYRRPSVWDI